ncbi:MAG: FG-GAP repeat protein, partial [Candidatus Thermoplasmatota archaeon]|nr:FG-GAP repeat protein [Candidatus Thermoplasmatota archaeon]
MRRLLAILLVLMLLPALPPAEAGNDARSDTDRGYLSEQWSAGLGTALGALESIVAADIDGDGEDELVVGNAQGYLHVLDWNATYGKYSSQLHSVDLGSSVRGLIVDQLDGDDALEIAYGYMWSGGGKVRILDGGELRSEENWTSGVAWSNGYNPPDAEMEPYGLAAGDLDGDGHTELAVGADLWHMWVVVAET